MKVDYVVTWTEADGTAHSANVLPSQHLATALAVLYKCNAQNVHWVKGN